MSEYAQAMAASIFKTPSPPTDDALFHVVASSCVFLFTFGSGFDEACMEGMRNV